MIRNTIGETESSTGRKVSKAFLWLLIWIVLLPVLPVRAAETDPSFRPRGLTVRNREEASLLVSWEECENADGYQVQYSRTADFVSSRMIRAEGRKKVSLKLTGLKPGQVYYVRVRSFRWQEDERVVSEWSRARKARITFYQPEIKKASNLRDRKIHLSWKKVPGADGYQIQYSRFDDYSRARKFTVSKSRTTWSIPQLKREMEYHIRLRAFRQEGDKKIYTSWSEYNDTEITFYPPKILAVQNNEPRKARIVWEKIPGAKGYEIQYSRHADFSSGKKLVLESRNKTSVTAVGLHKYETYYFRVRAYRYVGEKKAVTAWSRVKKKNIRFSVSYAKLDVPCLLQKPELPNGCESIALTNTLRYFGFTPAKCEIADYYIPTSSWDFITSFLGNPHLSPGGRACCAPAIVNAANLYLKNHDSDLCAYEVSDGSFQTFYDYIEAGYPVIIWTSMGQDSVADRTTEIRYYNGRAYWLTRNSHTVVLTGFDRTNGLVYLSDSLSGPLTCSASWIEQIYRDRGAQAVVIY